MSCYRLFIFILLFLLLLQLARGSTPPPLRPSPRNHPPCDSFSRSEQRSLCFQLQRIHNFHPFLPSLAPPPPPSEANEIDPRYAAALFHFFFNSLYWTNDGKLNLQQQELKQARKWRTVAIPLMELEAQEKPMSFINGV
ncbi:hypothetical protein Gogos_011872 [Gossypium gossypioides]|uniref:Uncharacterized protein n=1 Tax=Gossypium gossypioides TaxID=34282 RepID=A0A7J9BQU2_GOSGO|nr:hypothetical protein [Gossypium gossypioides]